MGCCCSKKKDLVDQDYKSINMTSTPQASKARVSAEVPEDSLSKISKSSDYFIANEKFENIPEDFVKGDKSVMLQTNAADMSTQFVLMGETDQLVTVGFFESNGKEGRIEDSMKVFMRAWLQSTPKYSF